MLARCDVHCPTDGSAKRLPCPGYNSVSFTIRSMRPKQDRQRREVRLETHPTPTDAPSFRVRTLDDIRNLNELNKKTLENRETENGYSFSLFHRRPTKSATPLSKIEAAYDKGHRSIDQLVQLLPAWTPIQI